jgi:phage terminase large subunit-like protein
VRALEEDYGGTEVGRQELDGELIEDLAGAIFSRALIEQSRARVEEAVGFEQVVVAVDPPAGASARSDACGIIVAGVKDGVVFVLADATTRGLRPAGWAGRTVAAALAHGAGLIVAEGNQGGEMVRDLLVGAAEGRVKVKLRHAKESKRDRAIPVSALYETGRVRHVRVLKELEDEMCAFGAEQEVTPGQQARSPDRVDALVWAVRELTTRRVLPRVDALEVRRRV